MTQLGRRPIYINARKRCYQIPEKVVTALETDEHLVGANANQKVVNLLIDALGIKPEDVLTGYTRIRPGREK